MSNGDVKKSKQEVTDEYIAGQQPEELNPTTGLPTSVHDILYKNSGFDPSQPSYSDRPGYFSGRDNLEQLPPINSGLAYGTAYQKAAESQSSIDLLTAFTTNFIGSALGTAVKFAGYMTEIPNAFNIEDNAEKIFNNTIVNLGSNIEQGTHREVLLTQAAKDGFLPLTDGSFWASNASSIGTTLGMFIPMALMTYATGGIATALQPLGAVGRGIGTLINNPITIGTASRYGEGLLEAHEYYNNEVSRLMSLGFTKERAIAEASIGAANVFSLNRANVVFDILQAYLLMGKGGLLSTAKNLGIEGIEEGAQFLYQKETEYETSKRLGLVTAYKSQIEKILDWTKEPEFSSSILMGMVGAGVFSAGKGAVDMLTNKLSGKTGDNIPPSSPGSPPTKPNSPIPEDPAVLGLNNSVLKTVYDKMISKDATVSKLSSLLHSKYPFFSNFAEGDLTFHFLYDIVQSDKREYVTEQFPLFFEQQGLDKATVGNYFVSNYDTVKKLRDINVQKGYKDQDLQNKTELDFVSGFMSNKYKDFNKEREAKESKIITEIGTLADLDKLKEHIRNKVRENIKDGNLNTYTAPTADDVFGGNEPFLINDEKERIIDKVPKDILDDYLDTFATAELLKFSSNKFSDLSRTYMEAARKWHNENKKQKKNASEADKERTKEGKKILENVGELSVGDLIYNKEGELIGTVTSVDAKGKYKVGAGSGAKEHIGIANYKLSDKDFADIPDIQLHNEALQKRIDSNNPVYFVPASSKPQDVVEDPLQQGAGEPLLDFQSFLEEELAEEEKETWRDNIDRTKTPGIRITQNQSDEVLQDLKGVRKYDIDYVNDPNKLKLDDIIFIEINPLSPFAQVEYDNWESIEINTYVLDENGEKKYIGVLPAAQYDENNKITNLNQDTIDFRKEIYNNKQAVIEGTEVFKLVLEEKGTGSFVR